MKKIIITLFAILPLIFLSCDNYNEDEFLTKLEGETSEQTEITKTQTKQTVLLEDYTGWQCTNCTAAAALIKTLSEKYGDQLLAMAVHAGPFAKPSANNNNLDLRTDYGTKWNKDFGIPSYPSGLINRVGSSSSRAFQKDDWDKEIQRQLSSLTHYVNINLGAKTDNTNKRFIISVKVDFVANVDFTTSISVVILEDSIVGVQKNGLSEYGATPQIDNYVFNHVLRTNGRIDLPFSSSSTSSGITISKNYFIDMSSSWNKSHCKALVFITNDKTKEIIQSNEIDL